MKRTIEAANVYAQEEARFVDRRYYPDYHAAPPVGWAERTFIPSEEICSS